jgi:hypothetical protein
MEKETIVFTDTELERLRDWYSIVEIEGQLQKGDDPILAKVNLAIAAILERKATK